MADNTSGVWKHVRAWLRIWWPVLLCVAVIIRESTSLFSGAHTNSLLRPIWTFFVGVVSDDRWDEIHMLLRKSGHFVWYGLTGLSFLRAWRLQWKGYGLQKHIIRRATVMAIFCTALAASADELHQSYLPDRGGMVSDVLLDTAGAVVMVTIARVLSAYRMRHSEC